MTERTKIVLIVGSTVAACWAGTRIVDAVSTQVAAGGKISDGIAQGVSNLSSQIGQGSKGLLVGGGVGFLLFLLLPPPFDLIGLIAGAGAAVGIALQHATGEVTVTDTGS